MKMPWLQALLPPPQGGGARGSSGGSSASGGGASARRLAQRLPTLQRNPRDWRSLLVHAVDLQAEIDSLQPRPSLTGRWRKCKASSDSMEPACEAVALPRVLRRAIAVLNMLEVRCALQ